MVLLDDLVRYSSDLLEVSKFKDYCPNGLQVQGKREIETIVSGVTANLALVEQAIALNANVLLVHHGFFWKGELATITGMKYQRIKRLITSDMSLLAYHLPLDAHPLYGNNVQLAGKLGISIDGKLSLNKEPGLLFYGKLDKPILASEFATVINQNLGRTPLHINVNDHKIQSIAWCTGAAQSYISLALELGVDAFVTGEISEQTVHIANECQIHLFAAGHHATERYGAESLGMHLAEHFSLQHNFIDIDNPV
ncbi:GTP cyclohydrolase 1 type 2 homolog YbgI [hydrothermal vent metagenome]|uniref:GTP cyclohydrolase 1 type 2 homolog YbgI n=1 Tax=hydrothermal vent metagenome TaxID=652676 RepID=A0A3B1AH88_9ZZZZ